MSSQQPGEIGQRIQDLADAHVNTFKTEERIPLEKARGYMNGRFFGEMPSTTSQKALTQRVVCTKNIVWAAVDTCISAILGSNPSVSATGKTPGASDIQDQATALIAASFRENQIREKSKAALTDGMTAGRAIFKQAWSKDRDMDIIDVPMPESVFFDLSCRFQKDIRYWLHLVPLTMAQFKRRVENGIYAPVDIETGESYDVTPDGRPGWFDSANVAGPTTKRGTLDVQKWIQTWEYYEKQDDGTWLAHHWIPKAKALVLKDTIPYCPFNVFQMNMNGEDCRGLSEVKLILPQQDTINDMLSHWKRIVYLLVPRIMYNSGLINGEQLAQAVAASTGAFVPISPKGAAPFDMTTAFRDMPMPQVPQDVLAFIKRQEEDAGYVSAVSEMARGRQMPARMTATAVAVMDQMSRTRIGTREANLGEVIERVAATSFFLNQRYMKKSRWVEVAGGKKVEIRPGDFGDPCAFDDMPFDWEFSSYNPIKNNPMILVETLKELLPAMAQSGQYDMRQVWKTMNRLAGIPQIVMISDADYKAQQEALAAQQQAAMQPPPPPAPQPTIETDGHRVDAMEAAGANVDQVPEIPPSVMSQVPPPSGVA